MDLTGKTKDSRKLAAKDTELNENPASSLLSGAADEDTKERKQLLSRIAVAGVVILGLLGGLAIFEVLNRPQEPALPKMAAVSEPLPVAAEPSKPESQPAAEEKPQAQAALEEQGKPTEAAAAEAPARETPPVPAVKPLTKPATHQTASIKPAVPAVVSPQTDTRKEISKVIPEHTTSLTAPMVKNTAPATNVAPKSAPPAHSLTPLATPVTAAPSTMAAEPRSLTQVVESAKRYLVQLGVFSNLGNAEDLVAKLQAAGIPAQIESRVQVGPFATRAEADAARAKLKAMGYDDGLLVRR